MASVIEYFICHFCLQKYSDQTCLITHLSSCHLKQSNKKLEDNHRLPRLTKTDRELLQLLKLHRSNEKSSCHKSSSSPNFDLPLTLNSIQYSKQKSFDDTSCQTPKSLLKQSNRIIQEDIPLNTNLKTSSSSSALHSYKYSRREQTTFYSSIKRARWKKQNIQLRRTRPNPLIFPNQSYRIHLPTEISSRQRLNTNLNNSFPLIFDPNFHSLVKLSDRSISNSMQTYFHLIHSIASQEFQLIIYSNDHEHQLSYTAYSFLHLLRQTMNDYSLNLQKTMKRNYFQTFNQPIVPNAKTPRIEPVPEIQIESPEQVTTISPSFIPIIEIEQKIEPIEIDELIIDRARIRVRNGSNQTQKSTQKIIPAAKNDENTLAKPTRMSTRLNTVIKTECLPPIIPTYETKPIILPSNELTKQWQTHTVFYRCHACSHEEFFIVLSRECMNLHISSHHGNMEENFKQRVSNFINKKGRSLKIFQHFLKWQQPWSEKQVEQIFQLSNK